MIDETILYPVGDNPPKARLLYGADVRDGLKHVADNSIQTICTSPPYWGLRDYGTATWVGGDSNCNHTSSKDNDNLKPHVSRPNGGHRGGSNNECRLCGAKRVDSQIGLEDSVEEYVKSIVDVFHACKRVLKSDGTLWLNLGDTYAGGGGASGHTAQTKNMGRTTNSYGAVATGGRVPLGLKAKDLIGIPWRVALALQADGWYLRNEIIWNKPAPMPESVKDRFTRTHESVFLFAHPDSKGKYYFDQAAVREPCTTSSLKDISRRNLALGKKGKFDARPDLHTRGREEYYSNDGKRNKRTVWTIGTSPYAGAHFACWPTELVKNMVLAGSAKGNTVLDPFSGSATTGQVAMQHGRNYIGTDLNEDYFKLAKGRLLGVKATRKKSIEPDTSTLDIFGA
tara:strand:- start:834 stop:2024 length:1191 start_codon:yes stop_codon:yes gene_type:complete